MGIVLSTIIYKAGKRRANKSRDKQEKARKEKEGWAKHSSTRAMYEYYHGDTSAMDEYYETK